MRRRLTLLFALALLAPFYLAAQCTLANFTSVAAIGPGSFPYLTSSGIMMNVSAPGVPTLGNTSYTCNGQTFACTPTAWWPNTTTHIITVTFSAPVAKFSFVINGTNQGEVFTIVPNAGAVTLSDYCTASFNTLAPNQLNDFAAPSTGTLVTINNAAGATSFVISHNGVGSGSRLSFLNCVVPAAPFEASVLDFAAQYRADVEDVQLDWKTNLEANFRGFEVQHSLDANAWDVLGFVDAASSASATKNYDFNHLNPVQGMNYYRLRKVDMDANYEFSEVQSIEINPQGTGLTVFPNPSAGQFELRAMGCKGHVEVLDMLGREIMRQDFDSQLSMDLSGQPKGVYWLKLVDLKRGMSLERVVLQ